jgi:hypothetical protein
MDLLCKQCIHLIESLLLTFRNFYRVLKSRVENYFKENNIVSVHRNFMMVPFICITHYDTQDPKIDYWMFLRYVVLFILANLGWFGMVGAAVQLTWELVYMSHSIPRSGSTTTTSLLSPVPLCGVCSQLL